MMIVSLTIYLNYCIDFITFIAAATVGFEQTTYFVDEEMTMMEICVVLNNEVAVTVSVTIESLQGTATGLSIFTELCCCLLKNDLNYSGNFHFRRE